MIDPQTTLVEGCRILDPLMSGHGFVMQPGQSGAGSGGGFAQADYVRGDRRLELHFRWSLGLVTYHVENAWLTHEDYMRVLLGLDGGNQYPGVSTDPLDAFRHLLHDLTHFAHDFLAGPSAAFLAHVRHAAEHPRPQGFAAVEAYSAIHSRYQWSVWRQDDSGNRFEIGRYPTQEAAVAVVAEFEARGHKQMYWVQDRRSAV